MNSLKMYSFLLLLSSFSILYDCSNVNDKPINKSGGCYYISNKGDDNNSGRSEQKPWKTIRRLNQMNLHPGDTVRFERNGVWREELTISNSGTRDFPIVISSYGEGAKPEILGSERCISFNKTKKKNVWVSSNSFTNPDTWYAGSIFFELRDTIIWGSAQKNYDSEFTNLVQNFDWTWYSDKIFIYSQEDPHTKFNSIEISQRKGIIILLDSEYIVINDLKISYSQRWGICCNKEGNFKELHGLAVTNCEISHIGIKNGMSAYGIFTFHSNLNISNNVFHDCGRRAISYTVYNTVGGMIMENVIIENNTFFNGYHTTSIDCQLLNLRKKEIAGDTLRNVIFRNNLIYNDPFERLDLPEGNTSNDIFFTVEDTVGGKSSYISDVYIYNNIIANSKSRAILINNGDEFHVLNNTIHGSNKNTRPSGSEIWALVVFTATKKIDFRNNIISGNAFLDQQGQAACLYIIKRGEFRPEIIHLDNNLYFQEDIKQRLIYTEHKLVSEAVTTYPSSRGIGWTEYQTRNPELDQKSPFPSNPGFIASDSLNFKLTPSSPAVGNAQKIEFIHTDYYNHPILDTINIGAIQCL